MHTRKVPTARCPKCSRLVELESFRPADGKSKCECGLQVHPEPRYVRNREIIGPKVALGASRMVKIFKHEGERGWFVADESGTVLIDGCTDLEAAICARQKLLARLKDSLNKAKGNLGT